MGNSLVYMNVEAPSRISWPALDPLIRASLQKALDAAQCEELNDGGGRPSQRALSEGEPRRAFYRLARTPDNKKRPALAALPEASWNTESARDAEKDRRSNIGNFQRVLVAEDHKATRLMLVQMLRRWGFEAVAASNGAEVLEAIDQKRPPELIIISRALPGVDALELCRRITNRHSEYSPYILMLAMHNDSQELVRALESGASEYLKTPFEAQELRARLVAASRILKRHESLISSRDRFRLLATKDPLTGLWNRRSIHQILKDELARAAQSERTTGVLLIDLDFFKKVNDTHGHLAGDFVLQETSRRLQKALRTYDAVGRYGGEEFLIVVPGANESEACELAERLRSAIERKPVRVGENQIQITLSVGVAIAPVHEQAPTTVLELADAALYDAKRFGRNRICVRTSVNEPTRSGILPTQRSVTWRLVDPQI